MEKRREKGLQRTRRPEKTPLKRNNGKLKEK